MQTALKEGRKALLEHEARELARSFGIIVPKFEVVGPNNEGALLSAAEKLGYPIAVKALSPDILHKTEAGAIMLDIKNKTELASAAKQITNNISHRVPDATVLYFLLEKMMPPGPELLIGGLRDERGVEIEAAFAREERRSGLMLPNLARQRFCLVAGDIGRIADDEMKEA